MSFHDDTAFLHNELHLPLRIHGIFLSSLADVVVVIAHGLGSTNPQDKSHLNDQYVKLIRKSSLQAEGSVSTIAYTARGHGHSYGWENSAKTDPLQFTWQNLYKDMIAVAHHYDVPSFVASGSSMGSGTFDQPICNLPYSQHWFVCLFHLSITSQLLNFNFIIANKLYIMLLLRSYFSVCRTPSS